MDLKKYKNYKYAINFLIFIIIIVGSVVIFLSTEDVKISAVTAILLAAASVPAYLQYRLDDRYLGDVVEDLTRLCDNLENLEDKEIFSENEDTLLSKLQNRIFKLIRIYKRKNELSMQEQENIKALVSDISHQLKTPLANLKMYTEFLADKEITESQRNKYIEIIKFSVERLNFLSESMIKISRLESGLISLNMQTQSINETVLTAVKAVFVSAKKKDIEITYNGKEEINVFHDRRWTSEAVFNLLDNAVKYSPEKSVISVNVRRLGMFMSIDIEDEAEVISLEERNKIFQRFYRGVNSRKKEGIGIGLYLSREIAVKQGGYINLTHKYSGNVFSMYLPLDMKISKK